MRQPSPRPPLPLSSSFSSARRRLLFLRPWESRGSTICLFSTPGWGCEAFENLTSSDTPFMLGAVEDPYGLLRQITPYMLYYYTGSAIQGPGSIFAYRFMILGSLGHRFMIYDAHRCLHGQASS